MDLPPLYRDKWIAHSALLLDCHKHFTGTDLVARSGDPAEEARRIYNAPFAVLSHGTEVDPILNYANVTAVGLWETTLEQLLATPSRLTAEPAVQVTREKLLEETSRRGAVTGYSGVRISATGRRFRIENVTIWNLVSADGTPAGQAAAFDRWT